MVSCSKYRKQLNTPAPGRRATVLICAVLAVITIAAYWPVLGADFVDFDDNVYVTENQHVRQGLTSDGVKWAFSMNGYAGNWHPLTWLSHMLDCELFGQNAGLHHLMNLVIHTASAVLLLLVFVSMTGRVWPSAFVAAVFALHPLHVESVAWIAERKDVLGGFFWILTMACYLRYTRTGGWVSYMLTLVTFLLGLMAKPMLVTLPFVLLLLDYWPLKRFEFNPTVSGLRTVRPLVIEKIPFFILAVISCVVTYIVQQAGGAVRDLELLPLSARLSNAAVSYVTYILKMLWPVDLAVLYPFKHIPLWHSLLALFVLVAITVAAMSRIRRWKYFAVGWLWYIGTLVPVIGLVQVGNQRLADRYTYIPLIGLFVIVAWGVVDLCRRRPSFRFISSVVTVLLVLGMFIGTQKQLSYWKNNISLFHHAIQVTENNSIMHNSLGLALSDVGQLDEAIKHYRCALEINPNYFKANINLGVALANKGRLNEAVEHYRRVIELQPDNSPALNNLAWILATASDSALRNPTEAVRLAERACALLNYNDAAFLDTLAVAYASDSSFDLAITTAKKAQELAEVAGNTNLVREVKDHLELFRQGRSYTEKSQTKDKI